MTKSLEKKIALAPLFYQNAPVVLDFDGTEGTLGMSSIKTLLEDFQRLTLIPVGITYSSDPVVQELAHNYKIPFINSTRQSGRALKQDEYATQSALPPSTHAHSHSQFSHQPEKIQIRTFTNSPHSPTHSSTQIQMDASLHHNAEASAVGRSGNTSFSTPNVPPSSSTNVHSPLPPTYTPPPTTSSPNFASPITNATTPSSSFPVSGSSPISTSPLPSIKINEEALVIKSSLRSGQQVYARNGQDLVILGSVHSGAEALADGNIHIYGSLKGRALAGVSGNAEAKIFSGRFHAELISIADTYCSCEDPPPGTDPNKPSVVWLENGNLKFSAID